MKYFPESRIPQTGVGLVTALVLLVLCIGGIRMRGERILERLRAEGKSHETDQLTDTTGFSSSRLAYCDFDSGNALDTTSHLSRLSRNGRQSLIMSPRVPFSPGLWIPFNNLNAPAGSWIRATGYVWYAGIPGELKASLVATCNHRGVNYKYMFVALEEQYLQPRQWNRISIDYRIPEPADPGDVLQAYFWFRGSGLMLVDDISVDLFTKNNH